MRVKIIEAEGTPEELARIPQLTEALSRSTTNGASGAAGTGLGQLDLPVRQLVIDSTPPEGLSRVERFMSEVLSWPAVEVRRGTSSKRADGMTRYLRFNRRPMRTGSFAYLRPANLGVTLRLPRQAVVDARFARARGVQDRNPHQVVVPLVSEEALEEALRLTQQAYEQAQ
jgi:hypothetical protein